MIYAILETNGKQLWVTPGKFYDIDKITAEPGDYIKLEKILFLKNQQKTIIGNPCINKVYAKGKILKHFKGRKITVFKMKPKKNMYSKNGHRQEISRVLIESINTTK
uniref:Large ribosomal subunit protein bL21c n=1 Tax=Helminthora furcellata TaxID=1884666 RepID=A0A1G4NQW1_9FLOR|nr:Ribosomal protein L21 [Helminthora furcellata]SCW21053.1 Ribosomal protein L21 [Helminthora furcellata]SCW23913.1 Ribosomal protein L21 [Helminthora furcellata]